MKNYIFLCIVCITSMLAPPAHAYTQAVYDTTITYEVANGKLYREFCVTQKGFPLPIDANVRMIDADLPKALMNEEIVTLATYPDSIIQKQKKILLQGENGNGLGIQMYEFFYEPYQIQTLDYGCSNNDVQELRSTTSNTMHLIRWDRIAIIAALLAVIILVIYFRKKIKETVGKIRF